jgi:hypothetical protein
VGTFFRSFSDAAFGLLGNRVVNVLVEDVGIAHRGCDVGMAHRPLNQFQVAIGAQQLGGEIVPQVMVAQRIGPP